PRLHRRLVDLARHQDPRENDPRPGRARRPMSDLGPTGTGSRLALLLAPGAVAASVVLATFADTAGHWATLVRPSAIAVLVGMGINLAVVLASRREVFASAISSIL